MTSVLVPATTGLTAASQAGNASAHVRTHDHRKQAFIFTTCCRGSVSTETLRHLDRDTYRRFNVKLYNAIFNKMRSQL